MDYQTQVKVEVLTENHQFSGFKTLEYDQLKPMFVEQYRQFYPDSTKSPLVGNFVDGSLKSVLPSMVAKCGSELVVMWGGFGNKQEWLPIRVEFSSLWKIMEINGKAAVCLDYGDILFPAYQDKKTQSLSLHNIFNRLQDVSNSSERTPAGKLSELEIGEYEVEGSKVIATGYGNKFLLRIKGKDYWANAFLNKRLALGINPTGKCLQVQDKYTTKNGNEAVTVALFDNY